MFFKNKTVMEPSKWQSGQYIEYSDWF